MLLATEERMKNLLIARGLLATGVLTALALGGCGSDDDGGSGSASSPVEGCKSFVSLQCEKVYGCLTEAELAQLDVGLNESDCKTKFTSSECTEVKQKCDSGKEYKASVGKECLEQYDALSCDQLRAILNQQANDPAACSKSAYCQ
jgi:hypothetical protein